MVPGLIESVVEWIRPRDEGYEVDEYVLSRREPDPENRIEVYDSAPDSDSVAADGSLPPGRYILQEVKANGMAGDVVWEEEIGRR